jgi:ribulose-phosphate 3-epimerase
MIIIPAILESDSDKAIAQINQLRGHVNWIQIDLADKTMTDSQTFDLFDLIGELDDFDVEIHLMSKKPQQYLEACEALNADRVYFHLAEVESPSEILSAMDPYDFTKGIVLSPQTSVEDVFTYIDEIDAVQVMTVIPGAQGGKFLEDMLDKISYIRERRGDIWIAVDGGMNEYTIVKAQQKGVDSVGVGSAILRSNNPVESYEKLVKILEIELQK